MHYARTVLMITGTLSGVIALLYAVVRLEHWISSPIAPVQTETAEPELI